MSGPEYAARRLRERAATYAADARRLMGSDNDTAFVFRVISEELRQIADEFRKTDAAS